MRVNVSQIPAPGAVPTVIVPNDATYNGIIFNAGAVNVQIGEDPATLQILAAGAFTAGVTMTPGQTLALIKWSKRTLYAASTVAGGQLEVILDAGC